MLRLAQPLRFDSQLRNKRLRFGLVAAERSELRDVGEEIGVAVIPQELHVHTGAHERSDRFALRWNPDNEIRMQREMQT